MNKFLVAVVLSALSALSLHAHGMWLAMRADQIQVVVGEGAWDNKIASETNFVGAKGYDVKFKERNVKVLEKDGLIALDPDESVQVVVVEGSAFWAVTPEGKYIQKSKKEYSGAKQYTHYKKIGVSYINQKAMLKKPKDIELIKTPKANKDLELEILPSVDPRSLKQGDVLKVLVLKNGKPLEGASVYPDVVGDVGTSLKTDKKGYASFKVRNAGLNVVAVGGEFPSQDTSKADNERIFSTLSFTLFQE